MSSHLIAQIAALAAVEQQLPQLQCCAAEAVAQRWALICCQSRMRVDEWVRALVSCDCCEIKRAGRALEEVEAVVAKLLVNVSLSRLKTTQEILGKMLSVTRVLL